MHFRRGFKIRKDFIVLGLVEREGPELLSVLIPILNRLAVDTLVVLVPPKPIRH